MWICMYPIAKSPKTSLWKKIARILIVLMMIIITLCAMTAYMAFIIENISTNLEEYLFTLMAFLTCSGLIYSMIVGFFTRHQIPSIFEQLASIYDDRKYSISMDKCAQILLKNNLFDLDKRMDTMHFLIQANETCEWMWSIYRKFTLLFVLEMLIIPTTSIFLCWFIDGELIVEHFFRPLKTMLVVFTFAIRFYIFSIFSRFILDYHGINQQFWVIMGSKCLLISCVLYIHL